MGKINTENVNSNVKDKKKEVLELIEVVKAYCFNFPEVNLNYSIPSFNNDFDVIAYLMDLVGSILGKKSIELQRDVSRWLIESIEPLELELRFNLKSLIKSCYACKINPRIAPWLFVTDPTDPTGNTPGSGINIEVDQFDFDCMMKINPRSDVGRTLYGGPSDMNEFLYNVIQTTGPVPYVDPVTGKEIATFEYLLSGPVSGTTQGGIQDIDSRNNVINMKIHNSYDTPNRNVIDFVNDYLNSFILFPTAKVFTQSMDLIFGVLTKKIKMDTGCVEKKIEFEMMIDKMVKCGIDDPNVTIDNGFFEFSSDEVVNIKQQVRDRQKGVKVFKDCNNLESSIDFDSLSEMNDQLENAPDKPTKVDIMEKGIENISSTSSNNMTKDTDKNQSKFAFLEELIRSLKTVLMRLVLSPKTVYLIISMNYMVHGQARHRGPKEWMENIICLLRKVLGKIIEKLSQFLLVIVLRGLKLLIKKYIRAKIEERLDSHKKQKLSLLPMPEGCSGLATALSNPAAIANTVVDAGFDQAENVIVNKNKSNNSGG